MSTEGSTRTRLEVMQEMHTLTNEMVQKSTDPDFFIQSLDQRQKLMDEYDRIKKSTPPPPDAEQAQIRQLAQEMIVMDNKLSRAMKDHRDDAKSNLAKNQKQQKVIGYLNQSIPAAGSFMDYKEK